MSSSSAASSASASPYGTTSKPGVSGPKFRLDPSSVEKLMIVIVRPWKFPPATTTFARSGATPLTSYPHLRAVLIAVSTASAPEFMSSAMSMPHSSVRSRRNGPIWSLWNARLVSVTRSSCSLAAAISSG